MSWNFALTVSVLFFTAQYAPSRQGTEPLTPVDEARVLRLGKELRCPVCQGLSIADSQSSAARAQLDKVRELVAQGKSDSEITDFFVARYGEWALLDPTTDGINIFLWGGPVLLLALGILVIAVRSKSVALPTPPLPDTAPLTPSDSDDPYVMQLRRDLEK